MSASATAGRTCSSNTALTQIIPAGANGNVALTGELDLTPAASVSLALGFGSSAGRGGTAGARRAVATASMLRERDYVAGWQAVQSDVRPPDARRAAIAAIASARRCCGRTRRKSFAGGMIASLSIPWGIAKGDDDLGGYHLVWPRDLVESAGGAARRGRRATTRASRSTICMATQEADGHWPQNMWLDGEPYWNGIQMDETALPILLADPLRRERPAATALDALADGARGGRASSCATAR